MLSKLNNNMEKSDQPPLLYERPKFIVNAWIEQFNPPLYLLGGASLIIAYNLPTIHPRTHTRYPNADCLKQVLNRRVLRHPCGSCYI